MVTVTFCQSGQITAASGPGYNTDIETEFISGDSLLDLFIVGAEAEICARTLYDWITNYNSVSSFGKQLLKSAAVNRCKMDVLGYDMAGVGRLEAGERINVARDNYLRILSTLKNKEVQAFIVTPAKGTI